eukprot:TRINITY_DN7644_c0_g1_i1.p1 TRINITY_DN7644_c0_g1~~TRINITY_DN7644_c0_g1_i1.p1  ORF type:complete len:439 (+),score=36.51 TRINITY_DN7644_c0_g1_i1:97-1317(+)
MSSDAPSESAPIPIQDVRWSVNYPYTFATTSLSLRSAIWDCRDIFRPQHYVKVARNIITPFEYGVCVQWGGPFKGGFFLGTANGKVLTESDSLVSNSFLWEAHSAQVTSMAAPRFSRSLVTAGADGTITLLPLLTNIAPAHSASRLDAISSQNGLLHLMDKPLVNSVPIVAVAAPSSTSQYVGMALSSRRSHFISFTAVQWCPSPRSFSWLAAGTFAGLVRLQCLSSLIAAPSGSDGVYPVLRHDSTISMTSRKKTSVLKKKKGKQVKTALVPSAKRPNPLHKFFCSFCEKGFKSKGGRDGHVKKFHTSTDEVAKFICQDCGKEFKSKYGFSGHRKQFHSNKDWHSFRHNCPVCQLGFSQKSSLTTHLASNLHLGRVPSPKRPRDANAANDDEKVARETPKRRRKQ